VGRLEVCHESVYECFEKQKYRTTQWKPVRFPRSDRFFM